MDMLISEKIPNMAKAVKTRAVVTGLFTAFLYMLMIVLLYSSVSVPEITASTSTPSLMRSCPSVTT